MSNFAVKWLVEDFKGDHRVNDLVASLEKQGYEYKLIKYMPFGMDQWLYDEFYPFHECVMTWGSINLIRQVQKHTKWIPGSFCNFDNLKCSTYFNYFGHLLTNKEYVFITAGEFDRRREQLTELVGINECIFVRPNSGMKTFTGHVRCLDDQKSDFKERFLIDEFCEPTDFIVVASPKNIDVEYRFVLSEGDVVTGSQYKLKGELEVDPNVTEQAIDFAKIVASNPWQPDLIYVADVACIDNEYSLLELNALSSSGFYDCDYDKIVKRSSELAEKEWKDFYNK